MNKKVYVWDLGDTLFEELWDSRLSGFENYNKYIEGLGYNLQTIEPLKYELNYEKAYKNEYFKLAIKPGFREVLQYCQNNIAYTTGNVEQMNWRQEVFNRKNEINVLPYFKEIISTFNFENSNKKTEFNFLKLIQYLKNNYSHIVYTDNLINNCEVFSRVVKTFPEIKSTCYFINNSELPEHSTSDLNSIVKVNSLYDILKLESKNII